MVFNNEIGCGHFELEFLNKNYNKSFEIIAAISLMIQLIHLSASYEYVFLLQVLTYFFNLMCKMWTKWKCSKSWGSETKQALLVTSSMCFWMKHILGFMNMILDFEYLLPRMAACSICHERFGFSTQKFLTEATSI